MNYWKDANDCVADGTADANYGTIYWQSEDSDAIATSFSDIQTQVAVQENAEDVYGSATTESIYDFLTYYSGYDNNSVCLLYTSTMYTGIAAFADNAKDGDGVADPREFMIYVPTSAQVEGCLLYTSLPQGELPAQPSAVPSLRSFLRRWYMHCLLYTSRCV